MAKRKRLTPPQPGFLAPAAAPEAAPETAPETKAYPLGLAPKPARRAPIAQVAGETATAAAVEELAEALASARAEGRLAHALPLDAIDAGYLVRDRIAADSPELDELIASLRARGQRTPIEVVDLGEGAQPRYGLISGWRRLTALRRLAAEDATVARIAAIVRTPDSASEAYLSMVEENEIRLGLSYYERARIVAKALEEGVFDDPRQALQTLFANVSRAKRSKIKSFMAVVAALDGSLRFPAAIPERLGLELAKRLVEPGMAARLAAALTPPCQSAADEAARLTGVLAQDTASDSARDSGPDSAPASGPAPATDPATDPAPDPAPKPKPTPEPPAPVYLDILFDKLVITGPGYDADLIDDLTRWLERRGNVRP